MKAIQSWLGLRVRALRLERGWTQEELASRAKKHPTYIGGIERGERNPTLTVLADIARALGVSLAALMEEDRG
ncbi:MAG: helix-turn-helix transcriptional regulator [Deltaproteobacteria bacterium]|jgi:transcriptional regulator with XRE-family HTH domain|nr:helix-turn-helix transcriptional regulator [Deltaproteobacteria bacterium]